MAFNIGDKVFEAGRESDRAQTIIFGPYQACAGGVNRYVVKRENGYARELSETVLKAAPKFKAGDRVTLSGREDVQEVIHGPFDTLGGKDRYLVKNSQGVHRFAGSEYMEPDLELQVGDRVRVLSETRYYEGNYAGGTGTLKEIDTSDPTLPYYVTLDNGPMRWLYKVEKI